MNQNLVEMRIMRRVAEIKTKYASFYGVMEVRERTFFPYMSEIECKNILIGLIKNHKKLDDDSDEKYWNVA